MDDLIHAVPSATGMTGMLRHPLEPLSGAEIRAVMAVIHASADFGPQFLFETVELKEPPRGAIADYEAGKAAGFEPLRGWFQALYEVLLGQSQGPRFGSFAAIFGLERTINLIEQALAGALAAEPA